MARQEFSRSTKFKALERAEGKCESCGRELKPDDKKEFDHITPCALGGDNSVENCKVLCVPCHKTKTKGDKGQIAKADRQKSAHHGLKSKKGRGFQTNKDGKFKRRLDGTTVERLNK